MSYRPLSNHVIVVAVEGEVNDWAAYIDAVPGNNFSSEWQKVRDYGTKLPRQIAEVIFPDFKDLRWRP